MNAMFGYKKPAILNKKVLRGAVRETSQERVYSIVQYCLNVKFFW